MLFGYSILLVDDHANSADLYQFALESLGAKVTVAFTCDAAIDAAK